MTLHRDAKKNLHKDGKIYTETHKYTQKRTDVNRNTQIDTEMLKYT